MKRICKKCGEEKELEEFAKDKKCHYGRTWCCKTCLCLYHKEYNKTGKGKRYIESEKCKASQRASSNRYDRKPESKSRAKIRATKRTQKLKQQGHYQSEKFKTATKKYNKKKVSALSDVYIKAQISNQTDMKFQEITPQMIELKRVQLKFHRELIKGKEVLNEIHSNVRGCV